MLRFLLYSSVLILVCSCGNDRTRQQEISDKFDSVNKSLGPRTKLDPKPGDANTFIYDSLRKRMGGGDEYAKLTYMRTNIKDAYAYIDILRESFFKFCGNTMGDSLPAESHDNIKLTNQFFIGIGSADNLYEVLRKARESMPFTTSLRGAYRGLDDILTKHTETAGVTDEPAIDFLNTWFKDVPPVAAVTVLNSFEFNLKSIESVIIADYVKKYQIQLPEGVGALR